MSPSFHRYRLIGGRLYWEPSPGYRTRILSFELEQECAVLVLPIVPVGDSQPKGGA